MSSDLQFDCCLITGLGMDWTGQWTSSCWTFQSGRSSSVFLPNPQADQLNHPFSFSGQHFEICGTFAWTRLHAYLIKWANEKLKVFKYFKLNSPNQKLKDTHGERIWHFVCQCSYFYITYKNIILLTKYAFYIWSIQFKS